jgi:hypothetical protein
MLANGAFPAASATIAAEYSVVSSRTCSGHEFWHAGRTNARSNPPITMLTLIFLSAALMLAPLLLPTGTSSPHHALNHQQPQHP